MSGKELQQNSDRLFRTDRNQENGDNFGLPDTGNSSSGSIPKNTGSTYNSSDYEPEGRSGGLTVILIILLLLLVVFLVYWFVIRKPKVEPIVMPQDTTRVEVQDTTTVTVPAPVETTPAQVLTGEISTITERTGRYYVVISSSVDSDLANDYAQKLSKEGVSCKILGPASGKGFSKVTVADFGTFSEANTKAEEMKGTYGNEIWVLKF